MANPTIKIDNSGGGSDDNESGSLLSTAVNGTGAATPLTFSDRIGFFGSTPDLSGVDETGLDVIFIDLGSGKTNFHKITGKKDTAQSVTGDTAAGTDQLTDTNTTNMTAGDIIKITNAATGPADLTTTIKTVDNGTTITMDDNADLTTDDETVVNPKQVTVSSVQTGESGVTWGIGGTRLTLAGAKSKLLLDNNGSAGDAQSWTMELQSGHTEDISAVVDWRAGGDEIASQVIIQGEAGGTRPHLTFTGSGNGFVLRAELVKLKFLQISTDHASASSAITSVVERVEIEDVLVSDGGADVWTNAIKNVAGAFSVSLCELANCTNDGIGITANGSVGSIYIGSNYIHDNGGQGVDVPTNTSVFSLTLVGNTIENNANGFINGNNRGDSFGSQYIGGNTFISNAKFAIEFTQASDSDEGTIFENNIFKGHNGVGDVDIEFSNASHTAAYINANFIIRNNCHHDFTLKYKSGVLAENEVTGDPLFVDAPGGDFRLGASSSCKATGFPLASAGGISSVDIGAKQRVEAGGGGGLLTHPGMTGGFNA